MAGYMTKLQGHVFEGRLVAAEELKSGDFVSINSDNKVEKIKSAPDIKFRVVEVEGPYGLAGLRMTVTDQGATEVFMVEQVPPQEYGEYDETQHTVKSGEFVRMHRPLAGEELLLTAEETVVTAAAVGKAVTVGSGSTLVVA